jgi:hypothetical protein
MAPTPRDPAGRNRNAPFVLTTDRYREETDMVYPHVEYRGPAYPDQLPTSDAPGARELDSRVSDGIHVRLLWHPAEGRVSVAVNDEKTGEAFELSVGDGDPVRDVFQHPYAYARA